MEFLQTSFFRCAGISAAPRLEVKLVSKYINAFIIFSDDAKLFSMWNCPILNPPSAMCEKVYFSIDSLNEYFVKFLHICQCPRVKHDISVQLHFSFITSLMKHFLHVSMSLIRFFLYEIFVHEVCPFFCLIFLFFLNF